MTAWWSDSNASFPISTSNGKHDGSRVKETVINIWKNSFERISFHFHNFDPEKQPFHSHEVGIYNFISKTKYTKNTNSKLHIPLHSQLCSILWVLVNETLESFQCFLWESSLHPYNYDLLFIVYCLLFPNSFLPFRQVLINHLLKVFGLWGRTQQSPFSNR